MCINERDKVTRTNIDYGWKVVWKDKRGRYIPAYYKIYSRHTIMEKHVSYNSYASEWEDYGFHCWTKLKNARTNLKDLKAAWEPSMDLKLVIVKVKIDNIRSSGFGAASRNTYMCRMINYTIQTIVKEYKE